MVHRPISYIDCRTYLENGKDLGIALKCEAWVEWMLQVTTEALRVSKGLVLWVVAGKTEDWSYKPGPEGLLWEWWKRGGHAFRPVYWHRVGIPGSGSGVWYRADIEYVLCFKRPGKPEYANPTANGHPPKWAPGGDMSHRLTDGTRRNQWGGGEKSTGSSRNQDGVLVGGVRPSQKIENLMTRRKSNGDRMDGSRPKGMIPGVGHTKLGEDGVLLHTTVGGGLMGHSMAHDNEAPYPVGVPGFFINSHCPPTGLVCDPFSGSGSTGQAAMESGRRYVGFDLRQSQCLLSRKRLGTITPGFVFQD